MNERSSSGVVAIAASSRPWACAIRAGALLGSALLYAACFPPAPWRWLAWVALVPLLIVIGDLRPRSAAMLGCLWTVVMAYAVNDWFPRAVSGYFEQPVAVGIVLFLLVSVFTAGVHYAAFAALYPRIARLPALAIPWAAGAAWVAADLARLRLLGGDPWALAGYSQVGIVPMMQIAELGGVHAITFLLVAGNVALAELLRAIAARRSPRPPLRACAGVAAGVLAALAYGALRMSQIDGSQEPRIPVAVVQGHLDLGSQWRHEFYGRNLDVYLRLSAEALRSPEAPRLVVWPESAMTFFLPEETDYRHAIASVLAPHRAQLITGGPVKGAGEDDYLNAAFLVAADGRIAGQYDKRQLLPFAEYFPFGSIDLLRRHFGRVRQFTPGGRRPLLETSFGPAGVTICNEAFFPEAAAERVRDGAVVLVNLANDSWLGDAKFSEPAFDMVTLRAVEERRWLIRASTGGPSAVVDPLGRVRNRTPLWTTATLAGAVEARRGRTPYGRVGDLFAWACVALTVAIAIRQRA